MPAKLTVTVRAREREKVKAREKDEYESGSTELMRPNRQWRVSPGIVGAKRKERMEAVD